MVNLGQHIIEKQNTDSSIQELAAQKKIYSDAKNLFYAQCIIATIIPIIISTIQIIFPYATLNIAWIFVFYTAIASVTELILDRIITKLKTIAASIQELFDCTVLNIPWNNILISEVPQPEIIHKYYSSYTQKESTQNLYDWYSIEIESVQTNIASVICQRSNCVYDFSIRKKYNAGLGISAIITFIVLFVTAAATGLTLQKFLTNVIAPSIPIILLAIKQYFSNSDSIRNLQDLKFLIGATLSDASITSIMNNQAIRQIQDKIYNNRILSPLLPDWIFYKFRSNLESQMHFAVKDIIEKIKSDS